MVSVSARRVSVSQSRTVLGNSVLTVAPLIGGRKLTLGTLTSGATMGVWCSSTIDSIKVLEQQGSEVTLDYRGAIHRVVIEGTQFKPFIINQEEGPNKKFTGEVLLIEV